jgi:peptidoglycan/xylan/chitin deacetylase (PgdA/CDA1 family)
MHSVEIGAAAGVASAIGFLSYAVRGRSAAIFGASVYRGDLTRPVLALTFDDGPSESTPALLSILARHRAPATFFMCGRNVRRCPDIAREVRAQGHEIGNHTESHPRLDFKSPGFIFREMEQAQETIQATTGSTPRWFRAPYGVRWFGVGAAQHRLGLTGVMWTVIGRDWRQPARRISERLLRAASNGSIICLHDGRGIEPNPDIGSTLEAVEHAIPALRARGFEFQTLSQILS